MKRGTLLAPAVALVFGIAVFGGLPPSAAAQTPVGNAAEPAAAASAGGQSNAILLTIFLRHDQSKTLDEINEHLKKTGWYEKFPPPGVEIVSWYVMMGIGQVVTLRLPASRVREVNRVIEDTAWGAYRTEFHLTYDYKAVGVESHQKAQ
jgi:hypothetical protein